LQVLARRDRVVVYPEGLWIPRAGFESRSRPYITSNDEIAISNLSR
jgi:hypothetical protein